MSIDVSTRRVLITGASGFVGTWLAEHFASQGAFVICLSAGVDPQSRFAVDEIGSRVEHTLGSVEDFDTVDRLLRVHRIDTVFHLAAVSVEGSAFASPMATFEINIRGTYNVLEACRKQEGQIQAIVIASSDKAYGDSKQLPYVEDMPLMGRHPYDVSKSCADLLAHAYAHSYGLPVAIGRFGNIFGPGDLNWCRLIPGTIRRLLSGERPLVRVPRDDVAFKRDFIYIEDVVRSYTAMLDGLHDPTNYGHAFNFAMSGSWTVPDVVRAVQRQLNSEHIEMQLIPQQHGEILHQFVAIEKARNVLGWSPAFTLDEGLAKTVGWYRRHLCKPATMASVST